MAITWAEQYRKKQRTGSDISMKFTDSETGRVFHKTFYFCKVNPDSTMVNLRIAKAISNIEFNRNTLNSTEIEGVDLRSIMKFLIPLIRQNASITQLQTLQLLDTEFPECNWKITKLFKKLLTLSGIKDFTEFKTACITKKFSGVDG